MDSKLLIAFAAGALLASGIVFMAVKEEAPPKAASPKAAPVPLVTPRLVPQPASPAPLPVAVTAPAEHPATPPIRALPKVGKVREKPSPLPPPVRREKPVEVARYQDSPPILVTRQPDPPPVEAQTPESLTHNEPRQQSPAPAPAEQPAPPEQPAPNANIAPTVTIAAGTILPARIGETISTARYKNGDSFLATLDRQLVVDGWIIADRGTRLEGRVVSSSPARLDIELVKLATADGQRVQIRTEPYKKEAANSTGNDVAKVGVGAVLGAAIGAAAGGGKGAAIGAGAGAAAGTAGAVLTHSRSVEIPVETRVNFRISNSVTITEKTN